MLLKNVFEKPMPMMDADPPAGGGGGDPTPPAPAPASIDYEKLAGIISGKQSVTEKQVLTGYLKQLGLSEEEMKTAAESFKEYKAKSQPNPDELKSQISAAKQEALDAQVQLKAFGLTAELGVELKAIPYIIKMADLKDAIVDGKIDDAKLKAAFEAVLKDIPSLKTGTQEPPAGFKKVGGQPGNGGAGTTEDTLRKAMGLKDKKE